jgi:hypothetical protein
VRSSSGTATTTVRPPPPRSTWPISPSLIDIARRAPPLTRTDRERGGTELKTAVSIDRSVAAVPTTMDDASERPLALRQRMIGKQPGAAMATGSGMIG